MGLLLFGGDVSMKRAGEDHKHWSEVADEWVAWVRKPNHDAFWAYRSLLAAFIGRGNGKALEVGCGEGRISRELTACGFEVTAADPVSRLVRAAIDAQSAQNYAVASAAELPFENAQFDLVVAYNVLMDVDDVPAALKEFRRVIRPTGQLIISICHPFADHGISPAKRRTPLLSSKGLTSAGSASTVWRSAMVCGCILPAGVSLSKPTG
jgi:ubiquinone/menaquinone biosynthesis C-methylase UbiE